MNSAEARELYETIINDCYTRGYHPAEILVDVGSAIQLVAYVRRQSRVYVLQYPGVEFELADILSVALELTNYYKNKNLIYA